MGVLYIIHDYCCYLLLYGSAGLDEAEQGATHHGAGGPPHGLKFFAEVAVVHRLCVRMNYDCYSSNIITMMIINNYYDSSLVGYFRGPWALDLKEMCVVCVCARALSARLTQFAVEFHILIMESCTSSNNKKNNEFNTLITK